MKYFNIIAFIKCISISSWQNLEKTYFITEYHVKNGPGIFEKRLMITNFLIRRLTDSAALKLLRLKVTAP